jgi:hypothetical protein
LCDELRNPLRATTDSSIPAFGVRRVLAAFFLLANHRTTIRTLDYRSYSVSDQDRLQAFPVRLPVTRQNNHERHEIHEKA